jgi:transglutaminase-like putative cysteine protease
MEIPAMRSHIFVSLGVLCVMAVAPLPSRAQFQPVSKEELSMTADPAAPGAAAVYLYREETTDDPHAFRTIYARIKVLTEEGKSAGVVHIDFPKTFVFNAHGNNSSRMTGGFGGGSTQGSIGAANSAHWSMPSVAHVGEDAPWDTDSYQGKAEIGALEGRLVHADGTVVPLTGKASELLKATKGPRGTETTFTLPGVEVGSVIEYRYQVRYDRYLTAPNWQLQAPYFIHKERFIFKPSTQFLPRTQGGTGVLDSALKDPHDNVLTDIELRPNLPTGKTVTRDAMGNYTVDLTDVPAIPSEPFAPPINLAAYGVDFFYTYTPDVKDYWQKQMSFWNKALNNYTETTAALQIAVKETVGSSDSALDKAKKLYALVQKLDNLDGSPDGTPLTGSEFIPHGKVESILLSKKGSSNEIAYLYLALVRAAGIKAQAVRVASRSVRAFSAQYMDNVQLDTALIALNIDGKEILVDPGTKMAPFEVLHWAHAGAGGVRLDASNKVETFVTPMQKNTDNSILHVGSVNLTAQGNVAGTVKIAFIGQRAIGLRQLGVKSGADAVKEELNKMISAQVPQGIQAKVDHVAYLDDPGKQLLAVINVSGSFAKNSGGHLVVPRLFFEAQEKNPFPADKVRELPIDMRYPAQEQEQITYVLPAGYTLKENPQDANLRWEENAAYQLRTKVTGDSITDARVLARGFTLLDAKDYEQVRDFYQKVVAADQQELVLAGPGAPSGI